MMQIPIEIEKPYLEIYDINKNILGILTDNTPFSAYNLSISQTINDTTKLKFIIFVDNEKSEFLSSENLVKFNGEYYVIKKIVLDDSNNTYSVECEHESCALKDRLIGKIEKIAEKVGTLVNLVLSGTGWVFGSTDIPDSKLRHLMSNELSVYGNLIEIANNFNARLEFSNTIVNGNEINTVSVYANPIDNGKFITKRRGYKDINLTYDSSSMVTKLTVFGRNDEVTGNEISMMAAHPQGLSYVENFSYFKAKGYTDAQIQANKLKFIKELTIRNSDLYTPKAVYDFALEEVARLCYPKVDASVNILDISVVPEYLETPPVIGEKVLVINEDINLVLESQIISIDKSYENPLDISIGISNVIDKSSSLKDMAQTSNVVEKITDGPDKKINGMWIKEATIGSAQIGQAVIDDAHIRSLNADKINAGTIKAGQISGSVIEAINLNASEATINAAKIGSIDAKKITVGDIEAERLAANIIQAINISSSGTISANKIESVEIVAEDIIAGDIKTDRMKANVIQAVNANIGNATIDSAKIGDLSADKITSGYIKSDLIQAGSITSDKVAIGDTNNLCKIDPNSNLPTTYTTISNSTDGYKYFKIGSGANAFIMLNKSKTVDFSINDEYVITFMGAKDYGALVGSMVVRYYYTDETYSEAGKANINLATISNGNSFNSSLANQTLKIISNPLSGKTLDYVSFTIQKDNSTTGSIYAKDIRVFKRSNGSLIVDGTIDANKIKASVINAINISTENAVIGAAKIGDLNAEKIVTGVLDAKKVNVIDLNATNITTGTLDASKVNVNNLSASVIKTGTLDGLLANIININASEINAGTLDASKIDVDNLSASSIKTGTLDGSLANITNINASNINTGTLDGLLANITNINASNINAGELDAAIVNVVNLNASNIKTGELDAGIITTGTLSARKVNITDLNASNITTGEFNASLIKTGTLDASLANITNINASNIKSGTISSERIETGSITSDKLTILDGFIKDAMIDTVNAAKIKAGKINTNNVTIESANGGIVIANSTQQFKDKDGNVRLQLGQDETGNFTFSLFGENGEGILIDEKGIKENAIGDGLIKNDMIGSGEIGGEKIDINSLVTSINNGSSIISGSKIRLDTEEQTLEVAFNELKTNVNHSVEIISTNGNIFKNGQINTKLMAIVKRGKEDITNTISANRFRWTRVSTDTQGDTNWNNTHLTVGKEVTITKDDVNVRATFNCEILEE